MTKTDLPLCYSMYRNAHTAVIAVGATAQSVHHRHCSMCALHYEMHRQEEQLKHPSQITETLQAQTRMRWLQRHVCFFFQALSSEMPAIAHERC